MTRTKEQEIMNAVQRLRSTVKAANIEAMEADDFPRIRALTGLMEELVQWEDRAQELLGDKVNDAPSVEEVDILAEGYPLFFRRGDLLVKQGLRRDGESTYEQKMPQQIYSEVLATLRDLKKEGEEFHAPAVIQRVDCPDYQVYLLLNLLQHTGHIGNPKRGLYRFQRRSESPWAADVWKRIPQESELGA